MNDSNALIEAIRSSVIGENQAISTPFGKKPLVYADYTASGRALGMIEELIAQQVLPYYANTHTETSYTGAQTSLLRESARQQIRHAINGTDDDQIIFCGPGATAAINKLIDILNLRLPTDLNERYQLDQHIPQSERPVVFIGPYEHHSNELPWRESIADLVTIPLSHDGLIDIATLRRELKHYENRALKIGSFSAASNVTGVKTDVDAISQLLHQYDALAFWDYAAASPYVGIDMQGSQEGAHKDAIFMSPHKFIGGPGTCGILVVNQHILSNRVPAMPGGGTVMYVTPEDHRYIESVERREEGGTPAIVESIRTGLVFKLQQQVGTDTIEMLEKSFVSRALKRWSDNDNIEILGNPDLPRLSIVSMRIKHQGKDLHYGFVVALLNDLFGIQARGGCSCAGPYGHSLLGMSMEYSKKLEEQLIQGHMILRPGWTRLNFNYFINEEIFEYLVRAVEMVAQHGWKLLPYYEFDTVSGVWRYQGQPMKLATDWEKMSFASNQTMASETCENSLFEYLAKAEQEISTEDRARNTYRLCLPEAADALRWFVLPQDMLDSTDDYLMAQG